MKNIFTSNPENNLKNPQANCLSNRANPHSNPQVNPHTNNPKNCQSNLIKHYLDRITHNNKSIIIQEKSK